MPQYNVIGLMSGSSLDGLDIVYCMIDGNGDDWHFRILKADCIVYPNEWAKRLENIESSDNKDLMQTNYEYGRLTGVLVRNFMEKHEIHDKVDFIASHGHTIFHEPLDGFSFQIGHGAAIAAECNKDVICDFRNSDIALGGQGAPIVPIADQLLFGNYKYCLNIGGIANISVKESSSISAYDICGANQVVNFLSKKLGLDFDNEGEIARSGEVNLELLNELNNIDFYKKEPPKSLSNQYVARAYIELIEHFKISAEDKLATVTTHIAGQISSHLQEDESVLATGGGAFNKYLIELIEQQSKAKIVLPDKEIIMYKEALAMALLGVLRTEKKVNVLSSVTGAAKDSIGGCIYTS